MVALIIISKWGGIVRRKVEFNVRSPLIFKWVGNSADWNDSFRKFNSSLNIPKWALQRFDYRWPSCKCGKITHLSVWFQFQVWQNSPRNSEYFKNETLQGFISVNLSRIKPFWVSFQWTFQNSDAFRNETLNAIISCAKHTKWTLWKFDSFFRPPILTPQGFHFSEMGFWNQTLWVLFTSWVGISSKIKCVFPFQSNETLEVFVLA